MLENNLGTKKQIFIEANYQSVSQRAADLITKQLARQPNSSFGMPFGKSLLGCYQILANLSAQAKLNWNQAKCFALDDYLDIEIQHSFAYLLEEHLYRFTNLPKETRFNPVHEPGYDDLINNYGGLDCCLLGIGTNGHIAFNEPLTLEKSWTHCVWLSKTSQEASKNYFSKIEKLPTKAVTMGIQTILASKEIILLANGESKKAILQRALSGTITESLPASFLNLHPRLTIITDFPV